jgi:Hypothetical glycosyl hydrolase family 15/Dockerin type I domain
MEMRKISIIHKKKPVYLLLVLLSLPILLQIPSVSSAIPDTDVNSDGSVNLLDFVLIANHFGESGAPGWIREDVDKNGIINILDITLVSNSYGDSGWTNDTNHIKKLSIAYSSAMGNTANQKFIANHFDMVDCPSTYATGAANVKALNPNITILGYYDAMFEDITWSDWQNVNSQEDWFVHDINGNRIERVVYPGQYLMNPNSGWSNYFAQRCKTFLTTYPQFDGVFLDDAATDLVGFDYTFKVSYSQFATGVLNNWESWMMSYMSNIKSTLGSHIVMPNCFTGTVLAEQTKCMLWENFMHGRSNAYNDNGYGVSSGLLAIDSLHTQAKLGNIIAVNSGCESADAHPVEAKQWMLFTYACFSFAVVDLNKAYFSWQFFNSDSTHGYYPEMDINLGQPIGDYYHVSGTAQVYARQFANYYVAANLNLLGTGAVTFTLNGASHTLSPRTAVFIPK